MRQEREERVLIDLEQRQVFFVLMGILGLASGILVMGYLVGQRLTGGAGAPPGLASGAAATDPVTGEPEPAPGESATEGELALTFHKRLAEPSAPLMSTRAIRERVQATVAKLQPPRAPKQRTKKAAPAPKALPAIVVKQPPPASLIPSKVDSVTAEALAVLRKLRGGVPAKAAKAKKAAPARRYTIQISAFRERNEAMGLVATLRKTGHNPYLVLTDMPGNGRWFRVRVGRFEDKKAATRYQARLARAKEPRNDTFITQM